MPQQLLRLVGDGAALCPDRNSQGDGADQVIVLTGQDMRELCRMNCGTCYTIMEKLATIISSRLKDTRLQLISLMHG